MTTRTRTVPPVCNVLNEVQIGTYEWSPSSDEVRWSEELLRIYGLTRAPRSEQEFGALLHPADRTRVEGETSAFLGSDAPTYSHAFRILRPDGSVRMILDRAVIERDGDGKVILIRGVNVDVTEDVHLSLALEEKLRASEGRYRQLFNAIDQGFCIVEVQLDGPGGQIDYRVVEANPAFYDRTGFPREIFGAWLRAAAPGLEEHWFQTYGSVARTGVPVRFENRSDLLGRWFDVYAFPFDAPERHRVAILLSDITARKEQEDHVREVVAEVNHRSKNMLGVIQAIARQTAASGAEFFLDRFSRRVWALAASNDLLAKNGWDTVMLEDLIRSQLTPFAEEIGRRIVLDGPGVELGSSAARTLGMAFHELATNAAKYGALSTPTGTIRVTWTLEQGEGSLTMIWVERGGPEVKAPSRKGFGSKVTTHMVEVGIGGSVTVNFAPEGLVWRLESSADRVMV